MPRILDKAVKAIKRSGSAANPYAVATAALQRSGSLKKGTNKPTAQGVKRGQMSSAQRHKAKP